MTKKGLIIAAGILAFCLLLAVAPTPIFVFLSLVAFWAGLWIGIRWAIRRWKEAPFLKRAQSVSDVSSIDYFRRVPVLPLENWVRTALTRHGFLLLGDPVLGRSPVQGYAWLNGKKAIVVMRLERALNPRDLESIYQLKSKYKAELAIVFSPFSSAPSSNYPGLEVLAGPAFLSWMSVLDGVKPMNIGDLSPQICRCGSPQVEHVSRAGEPVLICSRYPDCQEASRPSFANAYATV